MHVVAEITPIIDRTFHRFTSVTIHLGCKKNSRKVRKSLASSSWFTTFSQVSYYVDKPIKSAVLCFHKINFNFSRWTSTINHRILTNQGAPSISVPSQAILNTDDKRKNVLPILSIFFFLSSPSPSQLILIIFFFTVIASFCLYLNKILLEKDGSFRDIFKNSRDRKSSAQQKSWKR